MRTSRPTRETSSRALTQAAGGMVALGLLTALLATRLVATSASVDLGVLRSGAPTMNTLAPLIEIPLLGIGCVVAAWWSLSLALVTLAVLGQSVGLRSALLASCIRAVAPAAVRRLAVAGIGAGLVLTAGPALAVEPVPDLGWVSTGPSTPEAADTAVPEPTPAPPGPQAPPETDSLTDSPTVPPAETSPPGPDSIPAPATVTVAAGDTLWSITETLLPTGASDAEIAAAWPGVHAANASTIGTDPDVILVGQQLVVPSLPPSAPSP